MNWNLKMILASTLDGVIGREGDLLHDIPEDKKFFRNTTLHSVVVMGRKTWESIPERFRPLKDRINVVVSRNGQGSRAKIFLPDSLLPFGSRVSHMEVRCETPVLLGLISRVVGHLEEQIYKPMPPSLMKYKRDVFVIGGGEIYNQLMKHCTECYLTLFNEVYVNENEVNTKIDVSLFNKYFKFTENLQEGETDQGIPFTIKKYTLSDKPQSEDPEEFFRLKMREVLFDKEYNSYGEAVGDILPLIQRERKSLGEEVSEVEIQVEKFFRVSLNKYLIKES